MCLLAFTYALLASISSKSLIYLRDAVIFLVDSSV